MNSVDDRSFLGEARIRETNTQSKAVLSFAMTVMDKIDGWDEENGWVQKLQHASGSTPHACCVMDRNPLRITWSEGSYPSRKAFIWVCEEAFEVHEWVSELTISMQEEEILVALNYRIDVPCVVPWSML